MKARLANWNTGRLYLGTEYYGMESEKYIDHWNPVCAGSGSKFLSFKTGNGRKFGQIVCDEINMGKVEFLGLKPEYQKFMTKKISIDGKKISEIFADLRARFCMPNFGIAGAKCLESATKLDEEKFLNVICYRASNFHAEDKIYTVVLRHKTIDEPFSRTFEAVQANDVNQNIIFNVTNGSRNFFFRLKNQKFPSFILPMKDV
jgi:hypothetical protein